MHHAKETALDFDFPAFIEELLQANGLKPTSEETFALTRAIIQAQALILRATTPHRHSRELCALTAQLVRFCAGPESDDSSLAAECFLCMPRRNPDSEMGPRELTPWCDLSYQAGYRAFFDHRLFDFAGSDAWQCGWTDASRELERQELDLKALNEMPAPRQLSPYGPGDVARDLGLPLDEDAPEAWKLSWMKRDLELQKG